MTKYCVETYYCWLLMILMTILTIVTMKIFSSAISSTLNAGRVDSVRVLILVKLQGSRACISNSNDYFAVKGQNPIVEIALGSNMGLPQTRAVVAQTAQCSEI